ncbi:MAG: peptidoglycan DD-metalloendopeptidase family protein [Enterococcus sp.]
MQLVKTTALIALSSVILCGSITTYAETVDEQLKENQEQITSIKEDQASAKTELKALKEKISTAEQEVKTLLKKKTTEEQEVAQLVQQSKELETTIADREEQLEQQARDIQTNQQANALVDMILSSDTVNDAMQRTLARTTLIKANEESMRQQEKDQQELATIQEEAQKSLTTITEETTLLQEKQDTLTKDKLAQEVTVKELELKLATEEKEKQTLEKEKIAAEKKEKEQLQALAKQKEREETARKQVEKETKESSTPQKNEQPNETTQTKTVVSTETLIDTPSTDEKNTQPVTSTGWQAPLTSLVITSPFGSREDPTGASGTTHNGIDFAGTSGTPVFAAKSGTVVEAGYHWSAGNHVVLKHSDGHYSYYMHLSSCTVTLNQEVTVGTVLGGMGTTGNSTGVHLHFGVSTSLWDDFVDPGPLLNLS